MPLPEISYPLPTQEALQQSASNLLWAVHHRIKAADFAVLLSIASGCDTIAQVSKHTGLSRSGVHISCAKLTGRGRYHSKPIAGLDQPLICRRLHPHGCHSGQFQYALTEKGLRVVSQLFGLAPVPADQDEPYG